MSDNKGLELLQYQQFRLFARSCTASRRIILANPTILQ